MATTTATATSGRWALWGAAAGVLGIVGTLVTDTRPPEDLRPLGPESLAEVQRGMFHVGIVAGIAATFCVLVTAAGWRRWAHAHAPTDGRGSLAVRVVPLALTASAGAMTLGYPYVVRRS